MKNRPLMVTIGAVVALIVLALVTASTDDPFVIENVAGSVITPVQSFASTVSNGIIGFFQNIFRTTDLDMENAQLKNRIVQLEEDAQRLSELAQENERLRALLDYTEQSVIEQGVTARIVSKNPGVWFDIFTVNAGRNKGIEPDMPVISTVGVVGRVTEVGLNWCKVMSIIDSRVSIPVIVERTRDNGTVRGGFSITSDDSLCELFHLPFENDLVPGDIILTSGLGGGYPKGLMIGEVIEVSRQNEGTGRNALIKPAVDFLRLEEILIITSMPELPAEETP